MISMLLPGWLVGVLTFTLMLAVLLFWGLLLFVPVMLLRLLMPFRSLQGFLSDLLVAIASQWVASNQLLFRVLHGPGWQLELRGSIDRERSYLMVSNHQSWADILVLFDVMHGRTHFLRFFLKRELIWVPLIGVICWALDMPFMKRHSREAIAANPALRSEDLETTRQFCARYRKRPITVVNFLEGTRYSPAKRDATGSPFRHLLRPKSAGASFTLNAMGEQFAALIDVTLAYRPTRRPLLWSWLCGEQSGMAIHIDTVPIPPDMIHGSYETDEAFRQQFQSWVNTLWARKDARLAQLQTAGPNAAQARLT